MFGVVPNVAEKLVLTAIYANEGHFDVRLFTNNITPDQNTVVGDFTEASFPGYAYQTYNNATRTTDGAGKATFGLQSFEFFGPTSGSPVTVYGWFITGHASGGADLFGCGRFSSPRTLNNSGESVKFDLTFRAYDPH